MQQSRISTIKAGPAARRVAAMRGVELRTIKGTGPRGWITKFDATSAPLSSPPAASRAKHSATDAPYFHTSREIEWPESPNGQGLVVSAVLTAVAQVPGMFTRWTPGGINKPLAPTIIYVDYSPNGPRASRFSDSTTAQANTPFGATYSVAATDCMIIHDFAHDDIASASILPMDGVTASLSIGAPRIAPGVRDGGLAVKRTRTVTVCSDHRVIDGAIAAQWLQHFTEVIEQAACAS